jgi:preprotein translocase subunit YajC
VVTTWLRAAVREKVGPEVPEEELIEDEELVDEADETPADEDEQVVETPKSAEVAPTLEQSKKR